MRDPEIPFRKDSRCLSIQGFSRGLRDGRPSQDFLLRRFNTRGVVRNIIG